jgi:hypothetical protein
MTVRTVHLTLRSHLDPDTPLAAGGNIKLWHAHPFVADSTNQGVLGSGYIADDVAPVYDGPLLPVITFTVDDTLPGLGGGRNSGDLQLFGDVTGRSDVWLQRPHGNMRAYSHVYTAEYNSVLSLVVPNWAASQDHTVLMRGVPDSETVEITWQLKDDDGNPVHAAGVKVRLVIIDFGANDYSSATFYDHVHPMGVFTSNEDGEIVFTVPRPDPLAHFSASNGYLYPVDSYESGWFIEGSTALSVAFTVPRYEEGALRPDTAAVTTTANDMTAVAPYPGTNSVSIEVPQARRKGSLILGVLHPDASTAIPQIQVDNGSGRVTARGLGKGPYIFEIDAYEDAAGTTAIFEGYWPTGAWEEAAADKFTLRSGENDLGRFYMSNGAGFRESGDARKLRKLGLPQRVAEELVNPTYVALPPVPAAAPFTAPDESWGGNGGRVGRWRPTGHRVAVHPDDEYYAVDVGSFSTGGAVAKLVTPGHTPLHSELYLDEQGPAWGVDIDNSDPWHIIKAGAWDVWEYAYADSGKAAQLATFLATNPVIPWGAGWTEWVPPKDTTLEDLQRAGLTPRQAKTWQRVKAMPAPPTGNVLYYDDDAGVYTLVSPEALPHPGFGGNQGYFTVNPVGFEFDWEVDPAFLVDVSTVLIADGAKTVTWNWPVDGSYYGFTGLGPNPSIGTASTDELAATTLVPGRAPHGDPRLKALLTGGFTRPQSKLLLDLLES